MPLPPPSSARSLKHTRSIQVEIFSREDGLWDIDAHFKDVKPIDFPLTSFVIPAGRPVHDFWLRLTIDIKGIVVEVTAVYDHEPFEGHCHRIQDSYRNLIGLCVLKGFRKGLKERFSGIEGCVHMNELAEVLPYVLVQAFVFGDIDTRRKAGHENTGNRPIELDGCHALRTDGPAVATFYPHWAAPKVEA